MEEHARDIHSVPDPRCPKCRRGVKPGEAVCRNCGIDLTDPTAAPAGPVPADKVSKK